ncbi:manganese efflux pump MntP family protein [Ureibacillus terrenus]|uniref:manganese efflux pump MntP n=1 Tax=Ureibacillus terrenus TaxID=118246 RepID=UPI002E1A1346|nr:manganese efflux pump [Ureibacillus terrenus]
MQEIVSGLIVSLDVAALYLLVTEVKSRFLLSMWTAILHMVFPVIGFSLGNWMLHILLQWSGIVSSGLLFFIGLQILLSSKNPKYSVPIGLLAVTASLDTFSVSISFGMLNLQKYYFILSSGIWTFIMSYLALHAAKTGIPIKNAPFKWIAGLSLITISIYTLWEQ